MFATPLNDAAIRTSQIAIGAIERSRRVSAIATISNSRHMARMYVVACGGRPRPAGYSLRTSPSGPKAGGTATRPQLTGHATGCAESHVVRVSRGDGTLRSTPPGHPSG